MKKIIKIIAIIIITIIISSKETVNGANYEIKELIPVNTETIIKGEKLIYKNIKYENDKIIIEKIRNNSEEPLKVTISIGLFNEKKENIMIINYCSDTDIIGAKQDVENYEINVDLTKFPEETTSKDVHYLSVLNTNSTCRHGGEQEYVGKKVQDIYVAENKEVSDNILILLKTFGAIAVIIVALFIYKMLFTTAYDNMDGEDVRNDYAFLNKELEKEREEKKRNFIEEPKKVKTHKTDEIIEQEKKENEKANKDDSSLHNFYK